MSRHSRYQPLWVAAVALVALPMVLRAFGLPTNTATTVVILAIATTALNLCVGYTGLVSFGHSILFLAWALRSRLYSAALFSRPNLAADHPIDGGCCGSINCRRNSYLAPAWRLFFAPDPRPCRTQLHHRVPLDRSDGRGRRAKRSQ